MDSVNDTLAGGLPHSDIHGSTPARGSPWLFAACHVLHRLLVPRHPPNALLILDMSRTLAETKALTMHRNHPQTRIEVQTQDDPGNMCFPHTTGFSRTAISPHRSRDPLKDPSDKIVHRASEPSPSNRWGAIALNMSEQQFPVRQFG